MFQSLEGHIPTCRKEGRDSFIFRRMESFISKQQRIMHQTALLIVALLITFQFRVFAQEPKKTTLFFAGDDSEIVYCDLDGDGLVDKVSDT